MLAERIERIGSRMDRIRDWTCILLLGAIFVLLNIQIFFRYVLNSPLPWPEEIARTCFVWVAYVGVAKLVRERSFYAIDVFVALAPPILRTAIAVVMDLLMLAAFCLILFATWPVLQANANITTAIGTPINLLYLSLPIAAVASVFFLLINMAGSSARRNGGERQ